MRFAPLLGLITLLLFLPGAALAADSAVVVVKNDGTRLAGDLIEQSERGFLINGEAGLFLVPFGEVSHVEYLTQEAPPEPTPDAVPDPNEAPPDDEAAAPPTEPSTGATDPEPTGVEPAAAPSSNDAVPSPGEPGTQQASPSPRTSPPAGDGESWVVVRRSDGTTVSGTLVQQLPDAIVIRAGADLVTVPMAQVSRIASGLLEDSAASSSSGDPSTEPTAVPSPQETWTPQAPRRAADPVGEAQATPEFAQYALERLQLVDSRGFWLGPRKLGYETHQFKEDDKERFHAVVAGEPDYRLTFPEFLDLAGDEVLRQRYERSISLATARSRVGVVMLVVGGSLVAASTASMIVGATGGDDGTSLAVAVPLLLAGAPHIAAGGALFETAGSEKKRLAGFDLEGLYDRKEAFGGVQKYNAHLRARYGLPDTWRLDRPPR